MTVSESEQQQQERYRRQSVELCALLLELEHLCFYLLSAVAQTALDRVLGHSQLAGDLFDRHLLVVEHRDHRPLILGQRVQYLSEEPRGLFFIHRYLGEVLFSRVLKVDSGIFIIAAHLAKEHRLALSEVVYTAVVSYTLDPRSELVGVLELIEAFESLDVAVLQYIESRVLILDERRYRAVYAAVGLVVQLRYRALIVDASLIYQLL